MRFELRSIGRRGRKGRIAWTEETAYAKVLRLRSFKVLEDLLAHAAGESRVGGWAKVGLRQQRKAQGHIHAQ